MRCARERVAGGGPRLLTRIALGARRQKRSSAGSSPPGRSGIGRLHELFPFLHIVLTPQLSFLGSARLSFFPACGLSNRSNWPCSRFSSCCAPCPGAKKPSFGSGCDTGRKNCARELLLRTPGWHVKDRPHGGQRGGSSVPRVKGNQKSRDSYS